MTKSREEINRDIRDICYFIDHVKKLPFRISLIKELGYRIGYDVAQSDSAEKKIIIGKKGEYRVQIVPTNKKFPLVTCAIID